MRNKILGVQNIITLLIFIAIIPSIIAQQQDESNYYPRINESNYYPPILDSKNETANQANESVNFTISSTVSFAEELIGEKSYEPNLYDEKAIVAKAAKKQINIEPILKNILDSGYRPPSATIRISGREEQYKVPPGINDTVLIKIYIPNKPTESLYSELKTLGAEPNKYYQNEKFIKARAPIANVTKIALLPEVTDVRRTINFPLISQDYNVRVENNEQYYHVFLDVENHTPNATIIQTLENSDVKIKKQYNDGITDFRAYIPVRNLTEVAELPFVTHIEYHDVPIRGAGILTDQEISKETPASPVVPPTETTLGSSKEAPFISNVVLALLLLIIYARRRKKECI